MVKVYFTNYNLKMEVSKIQEFGTNAGGQNLAKITLKKNPKRAIWVPTRKLVIE